VEFRSSFIVDALNLMNIIRFTVIELLDEDLHLTYSEEITKHKISNPYPNYINQSIKNPQKSYSSQKALKGEKNHQI
jgi:hypothetical protein